MKELPLSNSNLFAIVDDEDFERLLKYTWNVRGNDNSFTIQTSIVYKNTSLANHVMKEFDGLYDHKDRNPLNNSKENLRPCTRGDNMCNRQKFSNCISSYKGVRFHKKGNNWEARITKDKKTISLGIFDNEVDAAKAYDKKAIEIHGEFALINFPLEVKNDKL